jgi:hypothetical protein
VAVRIGLGEGAKVSVGGSVLDANTVGVAGISVIFISTSGAFGAAPHPLISKNTNENRMLCFMVFSLYAQADYSG